MHKRCIGRLYKLKEKQYASCSIVKMSVNGASTIIGIAGWLINEREAANIYKWSFDRFYRLKRSGSLSCSIENEFSCDCPEGCGETTSCLSA
jgi:hypothetical protein